NIPEINSGTVIPYAVWDGGLAFFGGLIGLLISTYLISKKKFLNYFKLTDSILLFLPLIQAIGRLGNFFNYELYGKPTSMYWGIYIPQEYREPPYLDYTHFHPVFLYESVLNLFTFVILISIKKRFKTEGFITGIYLLSYSLIRLLMNTLRIDKEYFLIFETSDLLSALFLISGILIILNSMKKDSIKNRLAKFFSRVVTLSLILLAIISVTLNINLSLGYEFLFVLLTVVIPLLTIILFKVFGITSDFNVTKREERPKLFFVMAISFLLALILSFKTGDMRLITIYTTLNLTFVLGFLITLFWKVSFHMIWSILSLFFILFLWQIPSLYLLCLLIPLIGWSRLQLKRHTLKQVIGGGLLTLLCILLVLTFLKF
ncbi:prolipoprotein diacylglyceryl transferase, partial [candidate division WS6 bacterium RIFOXYB1_FULL_33_14]